MKAFSGGGVEFEQPPLGSHVARCIKIIDLGTQMSDYQGEKSEKHKIIIGWELPNALIKEGNYAGQPFTVSSFYTLSLHENALLRQHLTNWRGKPFTAKEIEEGFEMSKLLGKPCMVGIIANAKGRHNVGAVMQAPQGVTCPPQVNNSVYFSLDPQEFDQMVFDNLSDKIKGMIMLSPEWAELVNPGSKPPPRVDKPEEFDVFAGHTDDDDPGF